MPHHKRIVPDGFQVPTGAATEAFSLRPLQFGDAASDYEAWQSSIDDLQGIFGPTSTWPTAEMTLEDNAIDLAWHQREHETASSFAYTVFDSGNERCLGCVYISPSRKVHFDAVVFYWVRVSEMETGLECSLREFLNQWLADAWPFSAIAYPGRDLSWPAFDALIDREHW
jgi:hypothetical protein